jgi:hypothetical protein
LADLHKQDRLGLLDDAQFVGEEHTQILLPGGAIGATEFTIRIDFADSTSFLPVKIRRISTEGVELSTTELAYEPVQCGGGVVYLPRWARLTNRTADNRVFMIGTCTVTSMGADQDIEHNTFTMDFTKASNVVPMDDPQPPAVKSVNSDSPLSADLNSAPALPAVTPVAITTTVLAPAPKAERNDDQWSGLNLILLVGGLTALVFGLALIFRAKLTPRSLQ